MELAGIQEDFSHLQGEMAHIRVFSQKFKSNVAQIQLQNHVTPFELIVHHEPIFFLHV